MNRCYAAVVWALLVYLSGCKARLPRYEWSDARTAVETVKRRDRDIRSYSASGRILLERDDARIELRAVIVAAPPDSVRFRAWKLSQAVFDVTLNGDGLFVFAPNDLSNAPSPVHNVSHRQLTQAILLLPAFSSHAEWTIEDDADAKAFRQSRTGDDGSALMTCTIDKRTLTTQSCELRDDNGALRYSLSFDMYRAIDGLPWPLSVRGCGAEGAFTLLFDDVKLNPELSDRAFQPPARAQQQP